MNQISRASVKICNNHYPKGFPRQILVSGRINAVRRTANLVNEIINGEPGSEQAIIQRVTVLAELFSQMGPERFQCVSEH